MTVHEYEGGRLVATTRDGMRTMYPTQTEQSDGANLGPGVNGPSGADTVTVPIYVTMEPVVSSNIAAAGYHEPTGVLVIRFRDGAEYRYFRCSEKTWRGFREADSPGGYFHSHIKPGLDEFVRLNP